jgi:hypothetical protein
MAVLYKVDGTIETVTPKSGKHFTNEEVWELIGGWYETIPVFHKNGRNVLLVDEDGRMKNLPVNAMATTLIGTQIVGPALWTKGEGFG